MPVTRQQTLCKAERLNGKKQVDSLFMGGRGRAMSIYPIRMIYAIGQCDAASREPQAKIMVSVPKRYFKRAVKRNYVKRQVREAYRLNKHILLDRLTESGDKTMSLCFIWTANRLLPTAEVMSRMANLLTRLAEKLSATDNKNIPQ